MVLADLNNRCPGVWILDLDGKIRKRIDGKVLKMIQVSLEFISLRTLLVTFAILIWVFLQKTTLLQRLRQK